MIRDRYARWTATTALLLSVYAVSLNVHSTARADAVSEPDAYALNQRVTDLEAQVSSLQAETADDLDALYANDAILDERTADSTNGCLATSDYHYVRETIDGSRRRYRMPLVVWNTSLRACRTTGGPWTPKHRRIAATPLTLRVAP